MPLIKPKKEEDKFKKSSSKKKGSCYNYGKNGHYISECQHLKKSQKETNMVEDKIVAMVTEVNMSTTTSGWWFDTWATIHVCYDKTMFKTYVKVSDGQ